MLLSGLSPNRAVVALFCSDISKDTSKYDLLIRSPLLAIVVTNVFPKSIFPLNV